MKPYRFDSGLGHSMGQFVSFWVQTAFFVIVIANCATRIFGRIWFRPYRIRDEGGDLVKS